MLPTQSVARPHCYHTCVVLLWQVEALIAEHANCTMLNVSGQTPLDVACQNGHAQVRGREGGREGGGK